MAREVYGKETTYVAKAPEHADLAAAGRFYKREASLIADALTRALPGGTMHALLVTLLERKASLLRVRD